MNDLDSLLSKFLRQKIDQQDIGQKQTVSFNDGFLKKLTPLQQRILASKSKRKALNLSRRGGKTHVILVALLRSAFTHPVTRNLFISTTREHAKSLVWSNFEDFNERFSLGLKFNLSDLIITLPNRSTIEVSGCPTRNDTARYRGKKYPLVVIDEAGAFGPHLKDLCVQVLDPAIREKNGELWLSGTPNATCTGYFHETVTEPDTQYEVFKGDVRDNPYFEIWEGRVNWEQLAFSFLEEVKTSKDFRNDPNAFRREYLGEWVKDSEILVIPHLNTYSELPDFEWEHVIGIDFGYGDETALSVLAFSYDHPTIYLVDTYAKSELTPKEIYKVIHEYNERYQPVSIVGDPSPGKAYIEDLNKSFGLPIRALSKPHRTENIKMFSGYLKEESLLINETLQDTIAEFSQLQWKDPAAKIMDPKFPDHVFDAARYALFEVLEVFMPKESEEEEDTYEDDYAIKLRAKLQAEQDVGWWEDDEFDTLEF